MSPTGNNRRSYFFRLVLLLGSVLIAASVAVPLLSAHAEPTALYSESAGCSFSVYLDEYRGEYGKAIAVNRVSLYSLSELPYIGSRARDILALRDELGGFASLEQLSLIGGIGVRQYLRLRPYLSIR